MTMRVRACVLAVVLVVLGASSVFGQNVWTAGAPTGSVYAGATDFNLAMNAEGNRELAAPVTICTGGAAGGATIAGAGAVAAAGATTASFNVGDIYTIEYKSSAAQPDPIFAPGNLGALGSANLFLVQSAAGVGVTATASAAMVAGPVVAGAVAAAPQAIVTVTVTGAPAAGSGINCIAVQGMRFDLGNTKLTAALTPAGLTSGSVETATVIQTVFNATTIPVVQTSGVNPAGGAACTVAAPCAIPFIGLPPASAVSPGFPVIAGVASATNAVGTAVSTIQVGGGTLGISNSTGVQQNQKTGLGVLAAPAPVINGVTRTGTISLQQNPIPASSAGVCVPACAGVTPVNAPIQDGGGLFRAYNTPVGPDQSTWLNLAGATTGTTFTFTVAGMPTGSSVSFPAAVSSASPGVVLNMTGGGTIAAPGGSVSYVVTVNEGSPYALGGTASGPSTDITYTVTPGTVVSAGFGATVVISVGPAAGAASIPTYSQISGAAGVNQTVFPITVAGTLPVTLFTVATNQTNKVFPYVTYTGASTAADYDTGLVLDNNANAGVGTPRSVSVVNGTSCFSVAAGLQPPAGCVTIPVAATGNLAGQDGPFTIFFISSGATVASIRSTATCSGGGAFPGSAANTATKYPGLTSGVLKQGDYWVALASQVLSCAGITGAWSGQVVIVADIPGSTGFGFISQFFNAAGGATMGYVAP